MVHIKIMRSCSFGKIKEQGKDLIGIDTNPTEI